MRIGVRAPGVSGDVYGRWGRHAIWRAVVAPSAFAAPGAHAGPEALAGAILDHLRSRADAHAVETRFETVALPEGIRVSGRDAAGAGIDVVVHRSGEMTVTPLEDGRPVRSLVEDFRAQTDGLEYRAAPWRRTGGWLRFEAKINLEGDLL